MSHERDLLGELVRAVGRRHAPPPGDYDRVLLAAKTAWQKGVRARRRRRVVLAVAAGVVVVAVAVGTFLRWTWHESMSLIASTAVLHGDAQILLPKEERWQSLQAGLAIPVGSRVRTASGAGAALQLRNGVAVRLHERSDIALESLSVLRLDSGVVYVDTGLRRSPVDLRVDTPVGSVRDVGTVFELRATGDHLRVRVREGRVELDLPQLPAYLEGRSGEEVEVDRRGEVRRNAFSLQDPQWQWAEALAVAPAIEGQSLLQVLVWVAHETGRHLTFDEPATEAQARAVILHGTSANLPPLEALDLLLSTTDLEYVLPSDEVILIRRRQND